MPETELFHEITSLLTEQRNPLSEDIDNLSTLDVLRIINDEDKKVPFAIENQLDSIAKAVDYIVESFKQGGRLFYFGAGTSGRLGILDASECPPTFGTPYDMVQGVIAGGRKAVFKAIEGAEDSIENGANEVVKRNILPPDIVCGIAASGRTPFVRGALQEAKRRKVRSLLICTVSKERLNEIGVFADIIIAPNVGPEVIAGSTRMKSGTAQKLILNMLTTASMIRLGKTYGNVMVDLQQTNNKLKERSKNIIMKIANVDYDTAEKLLRESGANVKTALVMALTGADVHKARSLLALSDGFVKKAVLLAKKIYFNDYPFFCDFY
jgi:N-acetylmuramic acid 6-phosphate etherase